MKLQKYAIVLAAMLLAAGTASATVTIDMLTVGNLNNPDGMASGAGWQLDPHPAGSVDHYYKIGRTEVTSAQYTEFLNAVAATDTYALYTTSMMAPLDPLNPAHCKIERFGASGSYTYVANRPDVPVNWIGWGQAGRFVNWLHNGQPTGAQDLTTTEDGTYFINSATSGNDLMLAAAGGRAVDALFHLPSEDEWFKAAYYDRSTGTYFDYATSSNIMPTAEIPPGGSNSANYNKLVEPNGSLYDVGSYPGSVSPYGTLDQNGNVAELIDTTWPAPFIGNPQSIDMGGDKASADFASRWASNPQNVAPWWGFRVAAPASMLGDMTGDGNVDDLDIDALANAIRLGLTDTKYDITVDGTTNGTDGTIDTLDLDYLVHFLVETTMGNGTEYGDFNLDGMVDTTDLTRLATNYGPDDWKWDDGNANRNIDLVIDNTDLTILATYYGFGEPDVVPEPATMGLLALGGAAILRRRKP